MKTIIKVISVILVIGALGGVINSVKKQNVHQKTFIKNKEHVQVLDSSKKDLVLRNVAYGNDTRNTMNIIIPKDSNQQTPFVLFIHGGAWIKGDKNEIFTIQQILATHTIASAAMNYRYASSMLHYPELMSDVSSAVNYSVDHGKDWNIDTTTISLGGMSAGGHMALLYAYHYDSKNQISSVISLAGPTDVADVDFLDSATRAKLVDGVNKMTGATYEPGKQVPSQFKDASPIQYVKNVPTLIIHGTGDMVVPYAQAELLSDKLKQKSYMHDLMTIPNANHDLGLQNQATAKQVVDKVVEWVREYNK